MPFEHRITVRFNEVDRAGIAFFGRVYEYVHAAFEELLRAALPDFLEVFDAPRARWGMPLVHSEADYRRPMRHGDRLLIRASVERLGRRSITFRYLVCGADDPEDVRATVALVHAFVDLTTFEGLDAPEALVEGLRRVGVLDESADARA